MRLFSCAATEALILSCISLTTSHRRTGCDTTEISGPDSSRERPILIPWLFLHLARKFFPESLNPCPSHK